MADSPSIDPKSGFCLDTKSFHSLRPQCPLPPPTAPLSIVDYVFSLNNNNNNNSAPAFAFIDSTTSLILSHSQFLNQTQTLATSLQTIVGLTKGHTAFILSHSSLQIPILYFSLLSLGVIISPSNPSSTKSEISRQIQLSKPVIAFATSATAHLLPPALPYKTIILDSHHFHAMMTATAREGSLDHPRIVVNQSDPAAILYSSGTTGRVKGVVLTHRNLTAMVGSIHSVAKKRENPAVVLMTVPWFHIYGLNYCLKSVAMGETLVTMGRFDMRLMIKVVEEFRVTHVAVVPPVVVAMVKMDEGIVKGYDLRSLEAVLCGGAPLGKEVILRFKERFPNVSLAQAYGLTETTGGVFRSFGPEETHQSGATGRLAANCEAKVVNPDTGFGLPPCKLGELWVRGPAIMKGYIGDEEANTAALDTNGWLRTGDLCYIDASGFLYVVDRIKELIKYKGYQVAPAELEELLHSHPDIIDAAVIPYLDEEAGQVPMAFVVRHPCSSLDEAQVMDFVSKQVSSYKKIRRVSFIKYIPKNATGKILRKDLTKFAVSSLVAKIKKYGMTHLIKKALQEAKSIHISHLGI